MSQGAEPPLETASFALLSTIISQPSTFSVQQPAVDSSVWLGVRGWTGTKDMVAGRAPPTVARKQQRETKQEQAKKRNAPRQLVGCCVVRTAIRADYIHCVGSSLRRIVGEKLSSGLDILVCNLDAHSTNGVGVEPVHLDEMLILHVCRNTCRLQPSTEEVCLFGFAKRGDRLHARYP